MAGLNRRPPACKAGALPAELIPLMVGLGGLEPPTSPLSGVRSNQLSHKPLKMTSEHTMRKHERKPRPSPTDFNRP